MRDKIVLASASPRRLELLQQLGVSCEVLPVHIDESPLPNEAALHYVSRMAREKTRTCVAQRPPEWWPLPVLGADTIVELNGTILGKPRDKQHACEMLTKLSGKTHHVHTAVAVSHADQYYEIVSRSEVSFAQLHADQITRYIDTGEPMDKAGAYAIQGKAAAFVSQLYGSYSGVMGLPLYETANLLAECGIHV